MIASIFRVASRVDCACKRGPGRGPGSRIYSLRLVDEKKRKNAISTLIINRQSSRISRYQCVKNAENEVWPRIVLRGFGWVVFGRSDSRQREATVLVFITPSSTRRPRAYHPPVHGTTSGLVRIRRVTVTRCNRGRSVHATPSPEVDTDHHPRFAGDKISICRRSRPASRWVEARAFSEYNEPRCDAVLPAMS